MDAFVPIPGAAPAPLRSPLGRGGRNGEEIPSVTRSRLPAGGSQGLSDEVLDERPET